MVEDPVAAPFVSPQLARPSAIRLDLASLPTSARVDQSLMQRQFGCETEGSILPDLFSAKAAALRGSVAAKLRRSHARARSRLDAGHRRCPAHEPLHVRVNTDVARPQWP
ncbi:hypothetical protein RCH11_003300 [Glaciihabitans sp. GrIS 2.15]|nr:hypothetical protein [Glaciihabitans sp. GrIS 2.15]